MKKQGRRKRRIFGNGVASIEKQREKKLDDRRVYSKTKEYVMEEAREIFGLQMPNEIIVKPEN